MALDFRLDTLSITTNINGEEEYNDNGFNYILDLINVFVKYESSPREINSEILSYDGIILKITDEYGNTVKEVFDDEVPLTFNQADVDDCFELAVDWERIIDEIEVEIEEDE